MKRKDIIIIGGGLAGLTAALHLLQHGFEVVIFEKNAFPKHKVCGEYISNEVLSYFKSLEIDVASLHPKHINKLIFSLVSGKIISATLPLGGFGVSRYALDNYLYKEVLRRGGVVLKETVIDVFYSDNIFTITSQNAVHTTKVVLGAFGKRSNLDVKLNRKFTQKPSNWLGVKAHYKVDFPDDIVGLHHFDGGYCGVSKVENNLVNICYLSSYETFKKYKNIQEYQQKVMGKNPHLKAIFAEAVMEFDKPLTVSQISFESKTSIENHMLMIGDTAGLIHPLCGNGMAMAIHSAKLAALAVIPFMEGKWLRNEMEQQYSRNWNFNFRKRLKIGRILSYLLKQEIIAPLVMKIVTVFPFVLTSIIKNTHGKPI
ncbi:FAD-dependent oxidoreductase [Flavobacterium sp.]|uniref:NAD(P)/FAD-dependent oxidoreductase n=1 Tax=Flavobacterium sp. TaxID=239 RepID=UPI0025EA3A64|nr:FAD-dependent oxidoreductase [Flavobacterium sp.]